MRQLRVCLVLLAVLAATECGHVDSKTAVKAAIKKHLNQNQHLILNSFSTHFEAVSIHGDTAQALVKYQSNKLPNVAVEVRYGLKKSGGEWQVVSSSSANGQLSSPSNPHQTLDQENLPPPSSLGPVASH